MSKLKIQKDNDFPQELQKLFHFMDISSNFKLIGSSQYKNFLYSSDYDLNDYFKSNNTTNVLQNLHNEFKNKFKEAKLNPNMYITDFKCGQVSDKEPIRWNYKNIMKGYQLINKKRYNFIDCIMQKSIMKMDLIVFVNNIAVEITDNYFITIKNKSNFDKHDEDKNNSIKRLVIDYNQLIDEKRYFKAIKRLFSIQTIEGKPSKKLIDLFNSDLGRLYKCISDINTIILLLEQKFRNVPMNKIINNLQIIKYSLTKITDCNADKSIEIDNICKLKSKLEMKRKLESLVNQLNEKLNINCKSYLIKL